MLLDVSDAGSYSLYQHKRKKQTGNGKHQQRNGGVRHGGAASKTAAGAASNARHGGSNGSVKKARGESVAKRGCAS